MGERHTHLHDARLVAVKPIVTARIKELGTLAGAGEFDEVFDGTICAVYVECLRVIGAHEGTIWLLDETSTCLIPRFNNGPRAPTFVGQFRQSLRSGMISMVVSTEQPICENGVHFNRQQDKSLDLRLGLQTCAMVATPLYFGGALRGVLSAVQLKDAGGTAPEPPGFSARHLQILQLTASVLSRLVDQQLYSMALGLEDYA